MVPILVVATVFTFVAVIVGMALNYNLAVRKGQQEGGGSLGMSELRRMVREAVEEANEPVQAQLRALEQRIERLDRPMLPAASDDAVSPALPPTSAEERPVRYE